MSKLLTLYEAMYCPPDTYDGPEVDQFYRPWGFTIYRTSYEPAEESDMQWKALIAKIKEQAAAEIDLYARPDVNHIVPRLKELFFIDEQSDPDLLSGKSIPELRVLHLDKARAESAAHSREEYFNQPATWPGPDLFLLADADVLEGVTKDPYFWIKCVYALHDELEKSRPRNSRYRPPSPDGWFRMTTNSIVDLCCDLYDCDWRNLPPEVSIVGGVVLYNGELTGADPANGTSSGK
ncbi:hypothetical protein NLU13_1337 [Sarocladium strictum]|uniref:Uncharacterized protein n=1 Tax=Sarocladium strictum TaxID=5046 RepID=A0AA39GQS1_SARSR|nr:hypothetical protein NLU13_1337 [Sarocladium strictum]